mmetsp:Transcript_12336/g.24465  ORF Transcript_12336/g.24465 Transcript_12336/m.24465 type:complete len:225 (-) Transcript_12336:589-1263(-)
MLGLSEKCMPCVVEPPHRLVLCLRHLHQQLRPLRCDHHILPAVNREKRRLHLVQVALNLLQAMNHCGRCRCKDVLVRLSDVIPHALRLHEVPAPSVVLKNSDRQCKPRKEQTQDPRQRLQHWARVGLDGRTHQNSTLELFGMLGGAPKRRCSAQRLPHHEAGQVRGVPLFDVFDKVHKLSNDVVPAVYKAWHTVGPAAAVPLAPPEARVVHSMHRKPALGERVS